MSVLSTVRYHVQSPEKWCCWLRPWTSWVAHLTLHIVILHIVLFWSKNKHRPFFRHLYAARSDDKVFRRAPLKRHPHPWGWARNPKFEIWGVPKKLKFDVNKNMFSVIFERGVGRFGRKFDGILPLGSPHLPGGVRDMENSRKPPKNWKIIYPLGGWEAFIRSYKGQKRAL